MTPEAFEEKEKNAALNPLSETIAREKISISEGQVAEKISLRVTNDDESTGGDLPVISQVPSGDMPDFGDRFQVVKLVGEGGMGVVYQVIDPKLEKTFAVKVLRGGLADDKLALKRFQQEADSAIKLNHDRLVAVYEHNTLPDGTPYLVMDYIEGSNLADVLLNEGPFNSTRTINLLHQIADALEHVHAAGLVHRDLKPRNIILTKDSEGAECVKLVDFGIAKSTAHSGATANGITQTGDFIGSPLYMSPEQCHAEEVEARSDIYSLGCVLYEMLAGKTPFASPNPIKVVVGHLSEQPPPLGLEKTSLNNQLEAIACKCLEKSPELRYQSASQLRGELEMILSNKSPIAAGRSHERKNYELKVTLGAILVAVLAFAIVPPSSYPLGMDIYSALEPYKFVCFGGSVCVFLLLSVFITRARNKGQLPLHRKLVVIPWAVAYTSTVLSYLLLPNLSAEYANIYWFVLSLVFGVTVFLFTRYVAQPKRSFFSPLFETAGRRPTEEESKQLALWRGFVLAAGVLLMILFKGPTFTAPFFLPGVSFLTIIVSGWTWLTMHARLRKPGTIRSGDRWLMLASLSFAISQIAYLVRFAIEYMAGNFWIPYTVVHDWSSIILGAICIPFFLTSGVLLRIWFHRKNRFAPFGKSDGW